jgi:hypothetical protein
MLIPEFPPLDTSKLTSTGAIPDFVLESTAFIIASDEDPSQTTPEERHHDHGLLIPLTYPVLKYKYNVINGWRGRRLGPNFDLWEIWLRMDELAWKTLEQIPPELHTEEIDAISNVHGNSRSATRDNPTLFTILAGWRYRDEECAKLLMEAFEKRDREERSRGLKNEI